MIKSENSEIKKKIIGILAELYSKIEEESETLEYVNLINDLGMDSISFISLIVELETKFEIQIPDDWLTMETFQTYTHIYDIVEKLLKENASTEIE